MKPIFKCDVDECVVNSSKAWVDWMENMLGRKIEHKDNYGFGSEHKKELMERYRVCPMDFWRQSALYDTLKPIEGSQEALRKIKELGFDIVFVTHVKGAHSKSKHNFLRRYFGDVMDGYVVTKEKQFINSGTGRDVVIDDRNEYLVGSESVKLKFHTLWSQFKEEPKEVHTVYSWDEVPELAKSALV